MRLKVVEAFVGWKKKAPKKLFRFKAAIIKRISKKFSASFFNLKLWLLGWKSLNDENWTFLAVLKALKNNFTVKTQQTLLWKHFFHENSIENISIE